MNFKKRSAVREKTISVLGRIINKLDNTGNPDFLANGENNFLRSVALDYKQKDFIFFDVGANKGEYTELLLSHFDGKDIESHLFEPQISCFQYLSEKFSGEKRMRINNFGLSDSINDSVLYKDTDRSGLASLYKRNLSHANIKMDMEEKIALRRGDGYIREHKVPKISLMKIDVEGHEMAVLNGFGAMLNPEMIDYIQFEYGGANLDSKTSLLDLFTLLEEKGFSVCKMMPSSLLPINYAPRLENYIYQNYVAVNPVLIKTNERN